MDTERYGSFTATLEREGEAIRVVVAYRLRPDDILGGRDADILGCRDWQGREWYPRLTPDEKKKFQDSIAGWCAP
jgi:hypothetical protein